MLNEPLLPTHPHTSHPHSHAAAPISSHHSSAHTLSASSASDDTYVRPPDAYVEDILLPPSLPLEPQSSAASDAAEPPPTTPSLFRRLFTSTLFVYLSLLSVLSAAVVAVAPHDGCSHSLVVYLTGNAAVSALLALLTLYAAVSAPVDLSQLAVASERREPIRWVLLTLCKQLLGFADFVFFVLGHVAFFAADNAQHCSAASPALYYFALASLVSGYVGLVIPLLTFLYLTLTYRQFIFRPRVPPGQRQRPAHAHEVAACETRQWSAAADGCGEEGGVALCSICYVDYVEGDVLLQLPCDAKHAYHQPCIAQWLSIRDTCPLCKTRLRHALRKAGKSSAAVGSRSDVPPSAASLNEIAPFLPGTMAASFSLTAAYQQSQQAEQKEEEACPTPSPVGSVQSEDGVSLYESAGLGDDGFVLDGGDGLDIRICIRDANTAVEEQVATLAVSSAVGCSAAAAAAVVSSPNARSAAVAAALSRLAAAKVSVAHV